MTTIIASDHECNNEATAFVAWVNALEIPGLTAEETDDATEHTSGEVDELAWELYCAETDADEARAQIRQAMGLVTGNILNAAGIYATEIQALQTLRAEAGAAGDDKTVALVTRVLDHDAAAIEELRALVASGVFSSRELRAWAVA